MIIIWLLIYVVWPCCPAVVQTKEFFCNSQYIQSEDNINVRCFYVSESPATWLEAQHYCHKRRGWIANEPSRSNNSEHPIGNELLAYNDVKTIWSGLHLRNYRLLEDDFPSPYKLRDTRTDSATWIHTPSPGLCVIEEYHVGSACQNRLGEQSCSPQGRYVKRFVSCDEKHVFGCYFSGVDLSAGLSPLHSIDGVQDVLVYEEYFLPVQMYISSEKTPKNGSDMACDKHLMGGTTFRETERMPIETLNLFSQAINDGHTYLDLHRNLHWIYKTEAQCEAAGLSFAYSRTTKSYSRMSWPCESSLPAVCQRNRTYESKPTLSMAIQFNEEAVSIAGNEIIAPFHILLQFLRSPEYLLTCSSSTNMKKGQVITAYMSGIPIHRFYTSPERPGSYLKLEVTQLPLRDQIIDALTTFHCEMNDDRDNMILTSNRIYLRPSDLEVYSLHIDVSPNASVQWLWAHHAASVSDQIKSGGILIRNSDTQLDEGSILDGLQFNRWITRPMLFLPRDEAGYDSIVLYLYSGPPRKNSFLSGVIPNRRKKRQTEPFIDLESGELPGKLNGKVALEKAQANVREYLKLQPASYLPLEVTSAKLYSIDWCWEHVVHDNITNRNYSLPQIRGDNLFKSSQTCAQDGNPLVIVDCQGDRIVGYQWGPLEVNPLCNYASGKEVTTEVTDNLQIISQENINATNVDNVLNKTKSLTSDLTSDTVNTKDILYLADILQKSSEIDTLSPKAAQDMLDTANVASSLNTPSLIEAQRIGKASNRILQSMDKIGGRVRFGDNAKFQRIIAGQFALETWNLTTTNEESPIGLKVLSSEGPISKDNMISLYSEKAVVYDKAEVAIILPRAFIMSIVNNHSNNDVKLSLSVYRDTTLYSTVRADNNKTLNSKVIAAQLLVQGKAITDVRPYKVVTIFQPSLVHFESEQRVDRSMCAYWDFSANAGAGSWASDGCQYERTQAGRDVCVCDHLTNFAVLMSFYNQGQEHGIKDYKKHQLALSIITIIGLSLSIFGLAISMISFLCIKKLRRLRPQQTLFNLSLALLMSWVVFLAGVERTETHAGCIAVAAILHYLIMTSFMWMLMEAILQYLLFVKVINTYFSNYMLKTALIAWGLPTIPVITVFSIDPELYRGGEKYCWMSVDAFYYAFALPVGLIVSFNLIIFVLVVVSLCRRKNMCKASSQSRNQTVINIRASFICFFVLGMSWIFGFLTLEEARIAFQYIFCITSTLQGFVIFIMMTSRDKNVKQFWRNMCCRRNYSGTLYHTSNDKGNGHSSQSSHPIPRLKTDKCGAFRGVSNSDNGNLQVTLAHVVTSSVSHGDHQRVNDPHNDTYGYVNGAMLF